VVGLALCLVVFRVLSVLLPRQLGIVVDTLVQGKGRQSFVELAIYLLFCWLNSSAGIEGLRNWLWLPVEIDAHRSIATVAFNQVMGLSCDFHDGNQPEGVYAAVQQGKAVVELFESLLCNVLPMVLDLLIGCVYLTYLFGPYMALIATTTIVTYFWASAFFAQQQSSRQRIYSAACQRSFQVMCDTIGGWRTVAYFNRMAHMQKLYGASTAFSMKSERRYHVSYYYGYGLQTLIFDAGEAAACILAMYQIIYAGKSIGAFIFLMSYWQGLSGTTAERESSDLG
jgi:ABC-type transport system involved in Fe-S cluster assembly fused permease/ATPase subunit